MKTERQIWVVMYQYYDDIDVIAAYSSEAEANRYCEELKCVNSRNYYVEEALLHETDYTEQMKQAKERYE